MGCGMRHTPTGNPRVHGVVPHMGPHTPLRGILLEDPFGPKMGTFEHAS